MLPLLLLGLSLGPGSFGKNAPAPAVTLTREPVPSAAVAGLLGQLPAGVRPALLVRDVKDGKVLAAMRADQPFIAASTTKIVTGAAVLVSRQGAQGFWSTELTVPARQQGQPNVSTLTLRGTADPTLRASEGPNSLRELARQAYASGVRSVGALRLDETRLNAESFGTTVYAEPMPAVRLAEWENWPPRTAAEARTRLARALSAELRRAGITVGTQELTPAPAYAPYTPPVLKDKDGKALPPDRVIPVSRRPEQAVASVRLGPLKPNLMETCPASKLTMEAGTKKGEMRRGPRWA